MSVVLQLHLRDDGSKTRLVCTRFRNEKAQPTTWTREVWDVWELRAQGKEPEEGDAVLPKWDLPQKAFVVIFLRAFSPGGDRGYRLVGPENPLANPLFDVVRHRWNATHGPTWLQEIFSFPATAMVPPSYFHRGGSSGNNLFVGLGSIWHENAQLEVFCNEKLVDSKDYETLAKGIETSPPRKLYQFLSKLTQVQPVEFEVRVRQGVSAPYEIKLRLWGENAERLLQSMHRTSGSPIQGPNAADGLIDRRKKLRRKR